MKKTTLARSILVAVFAAIGLAPNVHAEVADGCAMQVPKQNVYFFVANNDGTPEAEAEIGDICWTMTQQFGLVGISKYTPVAANRFNKIACRAWLVNNVTLNIWTSPTGATLATEMCSQLDNGGTGVQWWPQQDGYEPQSIGQP